MKKNPPFCLRNLIVPIFLLCMFAMFSFDLRVDCIVNQYLRKKRRENLHSFYYFNPETPNVKRKCCVDSILHSIFYILEVWRLTLMLIFLFSIGSLLDTVQDFFNRLGMKPCIHLVEISIYLLYHVIIRPTKIMNRADKNYEKSVLTNF